MIVQSQLKQIGYLVSKQFIKLYDLPESISKSSIYVFYIFDNLANLLWSGDTFIFKFSNL